jgi:thiol-disulfide isomerase/thioredoxin
MGGQVKVGKVDCIVEKELKERFGVRGFPTIKVFPHGEAKTDQIAEAYKGGRTAEDLIKIAFEYLTKAGIEPLPLVVTEEVVVVP